MPERRQKQAGMWVKTQSKQSESEEEVDARSERGGRHVCSARLPHASSLCVSLSPSCLLWCLSVSDGPPVTVSLHPSVCLALLSFSASPPPSLCLSVSSCLCPCFCIVLLLCAAVFLFSSCWLSTYYILQSVLTITTHINTMMRLAKNNYWTYFTSQGKRLKSDEFYACQR